jgi:hypothetical protein
MKKYLFSLPIILSSLLVVLCSLFIVVPAYAATPMPEDKTTQIQDQLITNIASRVAQLKLVEKRGIIGKVTDATNTQITVTDSQDNTRFIDVDELTKFSNPGDAGSFGISDITKDMTVGILGLYNKESRRILARFVSVISTPIIIHGGISGKDTSDYTLTVITDEGKQIIIDIESLTRTYSYTQEEGLLKSGFSKIKENVSVIVTGVINKTDPNRLTASRITFFPEIPSSPKINPTSEPANKSK